MTDSLRPKEIDEAPSSEPSTIVTGSSPVLQGDAMRIDGGLDGGRAMPSPLGPSSVALSPHPPDASHDASQPKKPRAKMTLRIPDDEVARPSRPVPSSASPMSAPPPSAASAAPAAVKGDRIFNLSIDTPTKQIQVPAHGGPARTPSPAPAAVVAPVVPARPHSVVPPPSNEDTAPHRSFPAPARVAAPSAHAAPAPAPPRAPDEDSWTPYQPMAVDNEPAPDSASSVDIPIDMGSFDQEPGSGDGVQAAAPPARSLPVVAIGPLPPAVPPPVAHAPFPVVLPAVSPPPAPSSRAPSELHPPSSLSKTGPNAPAPAAPPASVDPPRLSKTGPNASAQGANASAPGAPPAPPIAPEAASLSKSGSHHAAATPPLPLHEPGLSRNTTQASPPPPSAPEPTNLAKSGAHPAAPPPPPPTLSRSPPPPEAAPVSTAPPSAARGPASTSAPPASGPDGFPEMVFDDNLFSASQRTASDAPPREAIVPVEPRDPEELPTAPRLPPSSSDHAALAPRVAPAVAKSRELIEELDIEPAAASEPSDHAELSPEDFVSVEAVPKPRASSPSAPPPPMRPRAASVPSINPAPAVPSFLSAAPPAPPVPQAPHSVSKPRTSTQALSSATVKMSSSAPDLMAAPGAPQVTLAPPVPPIPPPKARPLVMVPGASPLAPPPMSDTSQSRKRARPWWEELFNDDFIRTMAKISDLQIGMEVDFIEESLGLDKGAMVLDLACGTGRHAIELTRRGYQVVGFDLSLAMLAKAADEAQDRDQRINFVQGDMREMTFDGTFDGIYSWNTSFGFFEEEKNAGVIDNVRRALKPGGQVLLDVVNRDFVAQECPSLVWFEGDGCVCMDDMTIDWITSRMKVKRTMMMDDGRSREIEYSIRLYSLHELGKLLHDHGFRVAQVSGRIATPGVFFGANSPRTLILAEKK